MDSRFQPYFFIKKTFYLIKTENRTKKSITQFSYSCFEQKMVIFFKKNLLTTANLKASCYYKVYFLKLSIFMYLCAKCQVSSIILTIFTRRELVSSLLLPHHKRTPKKPIHVRVKVLPNKTNYLIF